MKYEYIKVPGAGSKSKPVQEGTHLNIVNLTDYEKVWSFSHSSFNTINSSDCSYSYENQIDEDNEKSMTETILTGDSTAISNYGINLGAISHDTERFHEERQYSDVSRLLSSTYNAIIKMATSIINCYTNCTRINKVDKSQSACSSSIDDFNENNKRKEGKTSDASNSWSNKLSEQYESKDTSGDPKMPGLIRSLILLEKLIEIVNTDDEVIKNEISAQESIDDTEIVNDKVISNETVIMTQEVEDNCFKKISNEENVNTTFDETITNSNNYKEFPKDSCSVSFIYGNMTNKSEKIDNKILEIAESELNSTTNTVDKKEYHELCDRPKIVPPRNRTVTSQTYSNKNTKGKFPWKSNQNYKNINKIQPNTMKPTVSSFKDVASRKERLSIDKSREYRRTNGSGVRNLRNNVYFEKKYFPKLNNKYIETRWGCSPPAYRPYPKRTINSVGNVVRPKPEAKSQASCPDKTPERSRRKRYPTNQFNIAPEKEYIFEREVQKDRNVIVKKIYLSDKSVQTRTTFNCHLKPNGKQPNVADSAKSEEINAVTEIREEKKFQLKITDEKIDKYDRDNDLPEYIPQRTYNCSNHLEFKEVVAPRPIPEQSINSTNCTIIDKKPSSKENLIVNQDTNILSEIYYSFCEKESAMNNIERNSKTLDLMKNTKTKNYNSKYLKKADHLSNSNEIKNDIAQEVNTNVDQIKTIDNYSLKNYNLGGIFSFIVSEISSSTSSYIQIKSHAAPNYTRFSLPNSTLFKILKEFKKQVNVDMYWVQENIISDAPNSLRSGDDELTEENDEEIKCLAREKYTIQKTTDYLQLQEPLIIIPNDTRTKEVFIPKNPIVTKTAVTRVQREKSKVRRSTYTPVYSVLNRDKRVIEFVNSSTNETFFVQSYASQLSEKSKIGLKKAVTFPRISSDSGVISAANVEEVPFKTIDHIVNIINKNERNKNKYDVIFTHGIRSCRVKSTKTTHITTSSDHIDKKEAFKLISIETEVSKLILNPKCNILKAKYPRRN